MCVMRFKTPFHFTETTSRDKIIFGGSRLTVTCDRISKRLRWQFQGHKLRVKPAGGQSLPAQAVELSPKPEKVISFSVLSGLFPFGKVDREEGARNSTYSLS